MRDTCIFIVSTRSWRSSLYVYCSSVCMRVYVCTQCLDLQECLMIVNSHISIWIRRTDLGCSRKQSGQSVRSVHAHTYTTSHTSGSETIEKKRTSHCIILTLALHPTSLNHMHITPRHYRLCSSVAETTTTTWSVRLPAHRPHKHTYVCNHAYANANANAQ